MQSENVRLKMTLLADGALELVGEIDSYTAQQLGERLGEDEGIDVLDLAGVTFIDSSGLRVLLEAREGRAANGRALALRAPSAPAQRLLEISGLVGHFDVGE